MIEINLLPGAGKKSRSKSGGGINIGAALAGVVAKVKDPWLIGAVGSVVFVGLAVGALHVTQAARRGDVLDKEQRAVQDSTRYAAVLRDRRKAEAQRDSVIRQLTIIRSIDDRRFIWPHIMEEVSRALPPYTWLTSLRQTSQPKAPLAAQPAPAPAGQGKPAAAPKAAKGGKSPDLAIPHDTLTFAIVGNTVDIQALTRFMRMLEASPFIEDVQLARSTLVVADGKEVTEFQLDAKYEQPDSTVIRTVPVTLSVR